MDLKIIGWEIFGFGPQSLVGVPTETGNNMRHHRKSYVEFKQNRNELMAVRCIDEELDHFASRVKWFSIKIVKNELEMCNIGS